MFVKGDIVVNVELVVTLTGLVVAVIAYLRVSKEFRDTKDQFLEILADLAEILLALRAIAASPEKTTQTTLDDLATRSIEVYEDMKSLGPKVKALLEKAEEEVACRQKQ